MSDELRRYHRQMILPDFGPDGQRRLAGAHAVVLGCGALGCSIADLLARAGVGTISLIDRDIVELTNLQRQSLFDERDAAEGTPKAEAAKHRLEKINSAVRLRAMVADFTPGNAERLLFRTEERPPSVLIDGTDNFETRYLLNDIAVKHGVPYVYGAAVGTRGMQTSILPGRTPCLRCTFEEPPPPGASPTCDTAGVFGPVIAVIAAHEASDAIKIMLGRDDLLAMSLLDLDLWSGRQRRVDLSAQGPRADCPCCSARRFEFLEGGRGDANSALCGQNAVQISPATTPIADRRVNLDELAARLAAHGTFKVMGRMLIRGRLDAERSPEGPPLELTVFADGRAIVKGTTRADVARTVYAKYVGN